MPGSPPGIFYAQTHASAIANLSHDEKKALSSREQGLTWSLMKRLHLLLNNGETVKRSMPETPRFLLSCCADGASVSTMKQSLDAATLRQ